MKKQKEMCCLCLNVSNSLVTNLFSKSGSKLTYFDKISTSLSQLANVLNESRCYDYLICKKCCDIIEMIHQFNISSLNNVRTYNVVKGFSKVKTRRTKSKKCIDNVNSIDFKNEETFQEIFVKTATFSSKNRGDQVSTSAEETTVKECLTGVDELPLEIQLHNDNFDGEEKSQKSSKNNSTKCGVFLADSEPNVEEKNSSNKDNERHKFITLEEKEEQLDFSVQTKMTRKDIKDLTCHICNKIFAQTSSLNVHLRIHSRVKPFMCHICGRLFKQKSHLAAHLFTHTGEKPHKCDVCKKTFTTKQNLDVHKLIHSDDKPHLCDSCHKQFRYKNDLVKHKRVHSGERPYACDLCDKAFISKGRLIDHRRVHTGERPFPCVVCGQAFTDRRNLSKHKLKHDSPHLPQDNV